MAGGASFTIEAFERLAPKAGTVALALGGMTVGGRPGGFAARVTCGEFALGVSKLDGEEQWIVDSLAVNGLPSFANGVGSRCTKLKAVKDEVIVEALDIAAEEVS